MIGAVILQIVLIFLNAIFASAEIAVISTNETKLQKMSEKGDRRAKRLVKLTSQPARFLSTIQVAITLAGFLAVRLRRIISRNRWWKHWSERGYPFPAAFSIPYA